MLKMQQWWFRAWVGRVRVLPYRGHDADLRKLAMTIFGRMKAIPGLATRVPFAGTDPDGDDLGYRVTKRPAHGRIDENGGNITYTPDFGFNGVDSLTFDAIHQIDATARAQLTDHWAMFGRHQRDLETNQALRTQVGIAYSDECFRIETIFSRDNFEDAETQGSDSIVFRISLRNLGSASGNQSIDRE